MRSYLMLAMVLSLAACSGVKDCEVNNPNRGVPLPTGPSIEEISVSNATHGALVAIEAMLRNPGLSELADRGVSVSIRSRRTPEASFGPMFAMEETSDLVYSRRLSRLNYGPYEACVTSDWQPGPTLEPDPPITTQYTDRYEFFVDAGGSCEQWANEAAGTAGWTLEGPQLIESDDPPPFSAEPFFGWTEYGLSVLLGSGQAPVEAEQYWEYFIVSPDLSNRPEWQNLPEIAFRMTANTDVVLLVQPQ